MLEFASGTGLYRGEGSDAPGGLCGKGQPITDNRQPATTRSTELFFPLYLYHCMKKNFWHKLLSILVNKYFLSFVVFAVWIFFFDQHNLVDRFKSKQRLNQLMQDTVFYRQKIAHDREAIRLLKTNPQNLERFAREQYRMKAPDEEIFVILKKGEVR